MSFNILRKVEGLEQLAQMKKLFLLHNKISSIANMDHFTCLEMLELGSNRIRVGHAETHSVEIMVLNKMLENVCEIRIHFVLFTGHREPGFSFVFAKFVSGHQ